MNRFIICLIALAGLIFSCKSKLVNYKNNMGIREAVVAQLDKDNYTSITWLDTTASFGVVKEGTSAVVAFRFTNTGSNFLYISEVIPSCGCTVVDYPKNAIAPGKTGLLTATFNGNGWPGFMHKTISITSNTINGTTHLLKLSGELQKNPAAR